MRVIVTGGGGFVGTQLARRLLSRGHLAGNPIRALTLVDVVAPPTPTLDTLTTAAAEAGAGFDVVLSDDLTSTAPPLIEQDGSEPCAVYHFASIMSGQSETEPDLAWRTNVEGLRSVLEACSTRSMAPRLVFSSSAAVFGPEETVGDSTKLVPHSTYGMTKAICEMMVNDYSRRGGVDGRSARLPTIIVRPGAPNAATTSAYSSVVREALNGEVAVLNVDGDYPHPVSGHRTLVDSLVTLCEADVAALGVDRAVNLPAIQVTLNRLREATVRFAEANGLPCGEFDTTIDDRLNAIVTSFCSDVDFSRAAALGLRADPSIESLIADYAEDFLGVPKPATSLPTVGFIGAAGFMGSGMVSNLAKQGYPLVLQNRTKAKAESLAATLDTEVSVVDTPADVAKACDIVLSCLGTEAACERAMFGPSGVFAGIEAREDGAPVTVIDHATVSPVLSTRCAAAASSTPNVRFLDAPISGGPEGAAAGTLSIMVGGTPDAFSAAEPVLQAMGSCVMRMGDVTAGTAAKLVNQALVGVHAQAAAEALALATRLGITDIHQLVRLLSVSWGDSRILRRVGGVVADAGADTGVDAFADSGAPLRNLAKDLGLILAAAAVPGSSQLNTLPATALSEYTFAGLTEEGLGGHDMAVAFAKLQGRK